MRNTIYNAITRNQIKPIKHLGCDMEQFRAYIESLFKPDMNWNNFGDW